MTLTAEIASRQVENFLDANKSALYMSSTEAMKQSEEDVANNKYTYVTTFSKPRSVEPIPRAVARVTFYVSGTVDKIKINYRVENETAVRNHTHRRFTPNVNLPSWHGDGLAEGT